MTATAMLDRQRLARVLGLLGSSHGGEVLAAARQAERLRCRAGVTWFDILEPKPEVIAPIAPEMSTSDAIRVCRARTDLLTPWESDFVASLTRQRAQISAKQETILRNILAKVQAAEARPV